VNPSWVSAPTAADRPAPCPASMGAQPPACTLSGATSVSPGGLASAPHAAAPPGGSNTTTATRMLYQQIWSLLLVLRSMQYWNRCLTLLHTHTAPDFSTTFASPNNAQMALLHTLRYGPLIQLLLLTLLLLIILFGDGLWMMSIVLS
jgi:hypothetical protein